MYLGGGGGGARFARPICSLNKSQELKVFHGRQKLTSTKKKSQKRDGRLQI